jgi:hypothetical protein
MKLNKILIPMVALLAVANMSCTESVEYTPVEKPTNAQVYFSNVESQFVDLEKDQSSFDLNVYRATTVGDVTINLKVTQPEDQDIFTIGNTVAFKDGSNVAKVNVSFDFANIVSAKEYEITLTVDDADSTPYGLSTCTYTISYVEPGDPLRDEILGPYGGATSGYEYWSANGYSTAYSYDYGADGTAAVVIRAGEGPKDVVFRGLFPDYINMNVDNPTGTVHDISENPDYADYEGYKGYIVLPANVNFGTYTYFYQGTPYYLTAGFGAAYSDGNWMSAPNEDVVILITDDGALDVSSMTGWGIFYDWNGDGSLWYFACLGYASSLTKI